MNRRGLSRRHFIGSLVMGGATLALGTSGPSATPAARRLRILMLGGTGFLGPHTVRHALERGHAVTLFSRGRTNPHLFPELEKLVGDRDGDLRALENRSWDAVVDTSGYVPRVVRASAELLAPHVDQYLFVSSISVYANLDTPGMDETAPLGQLSDSGVEAVTGATYGPLKALCEGVVQEIYGERAIVLRPGLIAGPGDHTDRFTYWPVRMARGGEVLAPAPRERFIQFIDVRDLGAFIITCLERNSSGVFNADRPGDSLTMGELLHACVEESGTRAQLTWVPWAFLSEQGVRPWTDLPVWVPGSAEPALGRISTARAARAGLTIRPVADTVSATLSWWQERPAERRQRLRAGLSAAREQQVLAAWGRRSPG